MAKIQIKNSFITSSADITISSSLVRFSGGISAKSITGSFSGSIPQLSSYFKQAGNSFGTTAILGTNDNQALVFETNNSERARIDTSGNLLINKTNTLFTSVGTIIYPSSGLDVIRDGNPTLALNRLTSEGRIIDLYVATSLVGSIGGLSGGGVSFNTSTTEKMRITSGGNVGIGTTSINAKLDILQSSTSNNQIKIYSDDGTAQLRTYSTSDGYGLIINQYYAVLGSPYLRSADFVASTGDVSSTMMRFFTKNYSSNPDERLRITSAGNVGIGTTSPSYNLSISGSAGLQGNEEYLYFHSNYSVGNNARGKIRAVGAGGGSGYGGDLRFSTRKPTNVWNEDALTIDSSGNVGIGTTSPTAKLTIVENTNGGAINLVGRTSDDTAAINFRATGDASTYAYISPDTNEFRLYHNDGFMSFYPGGTEKVRITSTGNVGIGTSSPTGTYGKLSVAGGIRILDDNNAKLEIGRYSSGASNSYIKLGSNSNSLRITNNTDMADIFTIENGGNVGIGTTSPVTQLHVSGSLQIGNGTNYGNKFTLYDDFSSGKLAYVMRDLNSDDIFGLYCNSTTGEVRFLADDDDANTAFMTFQTNASERMRITNAGNVGIGTTSPSQLLHVYKGNNGGLGGAIMIDNNGAVVANETALMFGDGGASYIRAAISSTTENTPYYGDLKFKTGLSVYSSLTTRMIIKGDGNVGIGTTSPSDGLLSLNGTYPQLNINNPSTGSGVVIQLRDNGRAAGAIGHFTSTNYLQFSTAGQTPQITLMNTGNVGIGTSNPTQLLELKKTTASAIAVLNYNDTVKFNINASSGNVGYVGMITNHPLLFVVNDVEKMRIDTNGNVGIGTSSPLERITFGSSDSIIARSSATDFNSGYCSRILFNQGGTGYGYLGFYTYQGGTGGGERMRITESGNVGIGTTTPAYTLEVASGTSGQQSLVNFRTADSTTANNAGIQIFATPSATATSREAVMALDADGANASGGDYFLIKKRGNSGTTDFEQYSNASMRFGTNFINRATYDMSITADGNVGIGTTAPTTKLEVYGVVRVSESSSGGILQLTAGASAIDIASTFYGGSRRPITFTMDGEKMRIAADGNVGIGTSSPTSKLHIDDVSTPYITITRAGVPTWQLRNNYPNNQYGFSFNNTTAGTVPLFIGTGGNIGIGLDNPTVKLDIASTQGNGIVMRYDTSTAYQAWIRPYWNSGTDTRIDFAINRTANVTPDVIMSVGYGGNVGIGTTAPASKLHISGSGQTIMRLDSSTTTNISQFMVKANTDGVLIMGMSGGSAASTSFGVTAAGQAFIGTTTLSTIHPTSLVIGNVSNIPIVFSTTNTEKARITPGGSLLVGTTVQAANTAGTAVATNFKGINAYEFNDTTGRGSTQGISWNYLINTTHIIDISPGDTVIAFIDVRLAAYSSSGSGYANSLFCYGGHVGAYNITTVFNVINGNVSVSAAIVSDKLRITITIANSGQAGECVLTVTDANKNGTLSTIVRS